MKPEILNTAKVTEYKWLNLYETTFEKDGKRGVWTFASRRRKGEDLTPTKEPDAVIIVPILTNGNLAKKLVVIKEYRIPIQDYEYHFPAGLVDPNECVDETAARELKEEAGMKVTKVTNISPLLYSSSGLTDESSVMVFVECTLDGKQNLEHTEEIEVLTLDYKQVCELADSKDCKCIAAKAWPIFQMYKMMGHL